MNKLSLLAFASVLALAACNKAPETTDNAAVAENAALPAEDANFSNESPVIEDASSSDTQAVTVAALPTPAASAPAAEVAPLNDAAAIEREIRGGSGIERIRYGEGWAWTRGGKIIRTAGRDGQDVAYFRGGEGQPFFVQKGDRSWGYSGGKPVREFDRDGKPSRPDADRAREAEQAAKDAHDRREHAEQARDHAQPPRPGGDRDGDHRNDDHGDDHGRGPDRAQPSPTPTPDHGGPRTGHDRPGTNDDARPHPTASPTGEWRRPERSPDRRPERDGTH